MIDLKPHAPDKVVKDSMHVTSSAAQMPFDYSHARKESQKPIDNETKGLEPFHASNRSGLSLYYQNSSVGDRLNFKERAPA